MKTIFRLLFMACCLMTTASSNAQELHKVQVKNFRQLQNYFTWQKKKPIIISGHRGGMMTGFPENSIASCEKTLTLMPSFFEIDPRLTKDSVLVLMHDDTIDRTTNGHGKVSDYTYEELRQFYLKDREGNITSYKIPTLLEMLEWGKDKTIFNLDNKKVPWQLYVDFFKKHSFPNIMLSVRSLEEALFYYHRLDNVILCVGIMSMADFEKFDKSGIPWNRMMAYVGYTMNPNNLELYNLLHTKKVMCMIAVAPTRDKGKTDIEKKEGYVKEIALNPDIIETDYPSQFLGLQLNK